MCRVAVGLYNCGHSRVLVSHPATKKCKEAINSICVPLNQLPQSDLVSEYIFIEGPTYGRTEKNVNFDPSVRTMCQLPGCNNFRPDFRCVELIVQLLRRRIEDFHAGFAKLKQAYETLDQDLALRHVSMWSLNENGGEWSYEQSLKKLEEALENLEEYHELCAPYQAMGTAWNGLVPNPVEPDSLPWSAGRPKFRCFPGKTFNKAACFTRKSNDKFDQLLASLQELWAEQDARNRQRVKEECRAHCPAVPVVASEAEKYRVEELFVEHDEMAGVDRRELEALRTAHDAYSIAPLQSLLLSSPVETLFVPDSEINTVVSPANTDIFFDAVSHLGSSEFSPIATDFLASGMVSALESPANTDIFFDAVSQQDSDEVSPVASCASPSSLPDSDGLSDTGFDYETSFPSSSASSSIAPSSPLPPSLKSCSHQQEDGDSQPATLAELVATSEPLYRFKDLPPLVSYSASARSELPRAFRQFEYCDIPSWMRTKVEAYELTDFEEKLEKQKVDTGESECACGGCGPAPA
ncbi:MAG: hypothetical protein Q9165_004394 [Trypethelium subeluteriae]